jgi:hypothetical protein
MTAALLFSQQVVVRAEDPQPGIATQQKMVIKTSQEWERLRASATSAEEFRALAKWADAQAGLFRKKAEEPEDQLRRPYPTNFAGNKILTNTVERYKKKAKYWSDLSGSYKAKAESLAVAGNAKP